MSTKEVPLESAVQTSLPDFSTIEVKYEPVALDDTPEDQVNLFGRK